MGSDAAGPKTAGFLQTNAAQQVQKLVESQDSISDFDRQTVLAFLSGGHSSKYSPQSGQITGILKQILMRKCRESTSGRWKTQKV